VPGGDWRRKQLIRRAFHARAGSGLPQQYAGWTQLRGASELAQLGFTARDGGVVSSDIPRQLGLRRWLLPGPRPPNAPLYLPFASRGRYTAAVSILRFDNDPFNSEATDEADDENYFAVLDQAGNAAEAAAAEITGYKTYADLLEALDARRKQS
jgi:hypothetical protein